MCNMDLKSHYLYGVNSPSVRTDYSPTANGRFVDPAIHGYVSMFRAIPVGIAGEPKVPSKYLLMSVSQE